jgi:hypothetical protein
MTAEGEKRKNTFEDGNGFIDHIGTVDALYNAVMAAITVRSFGSKKWSVRNNIFNTSEILVPELEASGRPPRMISEFDEAGKAYYLSTSGSSSLSATSAKLASKSIGDFHLAWAGDEMAYIDRLASELFMSLNKEE